MAGILAFLCSILVFSAKFTSSSSGHINHGALNKFICNIGGVVDCSSRVGREEKIAMDIAVQDFHTLTGYNLSLHIVDLSGKSAAAAFPAINLIQSQKLQAIVGALTWQEAALVAEMDNLKNEVPIISLTPSTSPIIPEIDLPIISMYEDISAHINCLSAFVAANKWAKVIALYEETNSYTSSLGIITLLSTSLHDLGVELEHYSAFPAISSLSQPSRFVYKELDTLKGKQSKVFILLQSSPTLTAILFEQAKKMGMMEKGYVWIMADGSASLVDSFNSSTLRSMQGVVGFKTHYSDSSPSLKEFEVKFQREFRAEYPEEDVNPRPSLFALRAYDAIWTIAKILQKKNGSKTLLQHILSSDFEGLSGRIHFKNNKLANVPAFQILNIVGKSYSEIGFWYQDYGFTEKPVKSSIGKNKNLTAEEVLSAVYWPGGRTSVPSGLMETSLPEVKQARIAVLASSKFTQIVKASRDDDRNITHISGYSINVFEAAVRYLNYPLMFNLFPFYGSHNDLMKEVSLKTFDAGIGDILITANRNQPIEFSQPYIEANLVMVVAKLKLSKWQWHQYWMFLRPFSKGLWLLMAAMTVFTGFVIWCLEHRINADFRGPARRQIGTTLWFAFSTVVFAHRESIRSQLSRLVLFPWLFLVLILTSTYTANLTIILTNPQLEPSETDIGSLKRTNAAIGCDGNPFTIWYLNKVLGFNADSIKTIASIDDFANALSIRQVRAAFMLTPHARAFLSEYCKEFTISGPTFKLSGFGYVFPKGSSLASEVSEAIIYLTQSGELQQLEEAKLSSYKCLISGSNSGSEGESLGVGPFAGLFIISGGVSVVALMVAAIRLLGSHWETFTFMKTVSMCRGLWPCLAAFFSGNKTKAETELSIDSLNPPTKINNLCHGQGVIG